MQQYSQYTNKFPHLTQKFMQRYQDEPITIGLRIKPKTRQQRRIESNRDFNEKQRVMQRQENFERHEEAQFTDSQYNEHHRFGDNFLDLQKKEKEIKGQQKQEYLRQIGEQQRQREQMYYNRDTEVDQRKQENVQQRGAQKNISGEKFNIITREYHNVEDQQKEIDQHVYNQQLAQARRDQLTKKQGLGVNILTGEPYEWNKLQQTRK